jgi:hypothetical protein
MATKKGGPTTRKETGKRTTARATSGLKTKQPAKRGQTGKVRSDAAREFAEATAGDVDMSRVIGSSQLSGEATRKLVERRRTPASEARAREKAAVRTHGGKSVASAARIKEDAEQKTGKRRLRSRK